MSLFKSKDSEFESEASSLDALIGELGSLMNASKDQDLDCSIDGYFGSSWNGSVSSSIRPARGSTPAEKTKRDCKTHETHQLLAQIIDVSFPIFWQPLYIGVAVDLKRRLYTHQRVFRNIFEEGNLAVSELENQDEFKEAATLAKRIHLCGYRPEHLIVATLPIAGAQDQYDIKQIRKVSEVAESWLNRFSTPRLGRI